MGQQPDQQPPDRSASSKGDGADVVQPSPPSSRPPAFEEVVIHPSPQEARRMTAQGRDRLMRPTASSGNGSNRPKRRVWSTVEEFPRQQPQSSPSKGIPSCESLRLVNWNTYPANAGNFRKNFIIGGVFRFFAFCRQKTTFAGANANFDSEKRSPAA